MGSVQAEELENFFKENPYLKEAFETNSPAFHQDELFFSFVKQFPELEEHKTSQHNTYNMPLNSVVRPDHLQRRYQEYLERLQNLLKDEIDPMAMNERGQNALMRLFENDFSVSLIYEMVEEAKKGNGKIPGSTSRASYFLTRGKIFKEGSKEYEKLLNQYRQSIKSLDDGDAIPEVGGPITSYVFCPDQHAEEVYKKKLEDEILQKKLEVARVLIPKLLHAGIDIDAVDHEGKTALVIAEEERDTALKQALLENGANEFDLKKLNPKFKYLTDRTDQRNISRDVGEWFSISSSISVSIKNRKFGEYPFAKLNEDNSISFFTKKEPSGDPVFEPAEHIKIIKEDFVTEQLCYQAKKSKFPIIGGGDILEIKEGEGAASDLIEYKLNLSPHDLNSILMQSQGYRGYRSSGGESILSLCKNFEMKDGAIMLFPAFVPEGGQELFVQAAGCQYCEIPALQLMRLLPNYQNEIAPRHEREGFSFHWLPREVEDALHLDRLDLLEITHQMLSDNGLVTSEDGDEDIPITLKIENGEKLKTLRVVEMDDTSRNFYSLYGNLAEDELANLKSVEVGTEAFLLAIQEHLKNKTSIGVEGGARLTGAKDLIQEMIVARATPVVLEEESPRPVVANARRSLVSRLCDSINPFKRNGSNQNR